VSTQTDEVKELREAIVRLEEQAKARTTARDLQAKEYERRLGELNHAHEQARQTLATYVPREMFEGMTSRLVLLELWKERETASSARTVDIGKAAWAVFAFLAGGALIYFLK
jgi:hypothetical protein